MPLGLNAVAETHSSRPCHGDNDLSGVALVREALLCLWSKVGPILISDSHESWEMPIMELAVIPWRIACWHFRGGVGIEGGVRVVQEEARPLPGADEQRPWDVPEGALRSNCHEVLEAEVHPGRRGRVELQGSLGYCVTRGLKDDPNQVRQPKPYTAFEQGVAIKNDGLSK